MAAMFPLPACALRRLALFVWTAQTAHALVHHAGGGAHTQQALGTEISGWTKVISCADSSGTDRLLFPAEEIQSMAELATRVKYCLYGSATDCVTSMANTFPIKEVREGGGTSHDDGVPCDGPCVTSIWEDDDPSTGVNMGDLWATCGGATSGLSGATLLHQTGCNSRGLHFSVNDGDSCCWYSGNCTAGEAEAGVEMYLDLIPGWTKVLSCADTNATDRLLFPAAEIQSLAMGATQVKYCLYGSTTDCVTSVADSFPIYRLRTGGATSNEVWEDVACAPDCVSRWWSDDSPSTGITLPDDLWATCGLIAEGSLTGAANLHDSCNNADGLHLNVQDGGACCWFDGSCSQGETEAGVDMYLNVVTAAPTASPTSSPTSSSPTHSPTKSPTLSPTASPTTASPTFSPTSSPTTASPTSSPTSSPTTPVVPTSFGDPHVSNVRGEKFDILSPGDFVYLSIPRGATAAAGSGALLRIVAKVEPLGHLCQERLLFVTGLDLSGQWLLGGQVRSLSLSTTVQAKMEAKALRIRVLPVPRASLGNGRSGGSEIVARDLNASELAAEFGPSAGLLEVTDYKPKALPGAVNQHVAVLLLKLKLGPTIAKIRMVQQREKDEEDSSQDAHKKFRAAKGKPRFSNSLWLTLTGLEGVLKGQEQGGAAEIGGILGFDDHQSATLPPQECWNTKQRMKGTAGAGRIHAMVSLGHEDAVDEDLS